MGMLTFEVNVFWGIFSFTTPCFGRAEGIHTWLIAFQKPSESGTLFPNQHSVSSKRQSVL
jgi:hypothetical protein